MENFEEKFYQFLFRFYNFSGALCLKFDGKRFTISIFHILKVLIFIVLFLISMIIFYLTAKIKDEEAPNVKLTKFSSVIVRSAFLVPLFLAFLIMVIQTQINNDITKIFDTFLFCKKKFEINQDKLRSFYSKVFKYFLFYIIQIFVTMIIHFLAAKLVLDVKSIWTFISGIIINVCYNSIMAFVNSLLLHFDFLFENCEESLRKTRKAHNSHDNIIDIKKVEILSRLTEIFNRSVSKVLTACTTYCVVAIVVLVSFNSMEIFSKNYNSSRLLVCC